MKKNLLPSVLKELEKYNTKITIVLEMSDKETISSIEGFNCNILFQKGKGYGDALIQGINSVKTDYFCIFNADGSFKPEELSGMLDLAVNYNYDLIFGSRYEKNSSSEDDTIITFIGNKIFSLLGKIFFITHNRYPLYLCAWKNQKSK